jgi:uncharacterized protein
MHQYSDQERKILLELAHESIAYGLKNNQHMPIDVVDYPKHLQEERTCFVTLHLQGQLKGCIGSLEAHQSLVQDVIHNAYTAAFQDPRFYPLTAEEFPEIKIHISVLSKPELISFTSEEDLLGKIRPKIDGLILSEGLNKGTFLPAVWQELPDKALFLKHLKLKAGLSENYWSDTLKVERYTAESIE